MKKLFFCVLLFSQIAYAQIPGKMSPKKGGMRGMPPMGEGMPGMQPTEGFTRNGYVPYKCKPVETSSKSSGILSLNKLGSPSSYYDYTEEKLYIAPGAGVSVSVDDFQTIYNDFLSGKSSPPTEGVSQVNLCTTGNSQCNYNWANQTACYKIYLTGGGYLSTFCMGPNLENGDNSSKVTTFTRENVWNFLICGGNPN